MTEPDDGYFADQQHADEYASYGTHDDYNDSTENNESATDPEESNDTEESS